MTATTGLCVDLTVASLVAGNTDAGNRVYTPGDWPQRTSIFPVLLVQATREEKTPTGRGAIAFTTVATIRVTCRTSAPGAPEDQGGLDAVQKLWRLQRQLEVAVINSDLFVDPDTGQHFLQQLPSIRSAVGTSGEGAAQIAELVMEIGMEFFQGPEAFFPSAETAITTITLDDQRPAIGLTGVPA